MIDFEIDIKECIKALDSGGTILYPTDTIWGIGCDALNEEAIEKIYNIKQRPKDKSFIILLAESKDVLQYVAAPPPDIIAMVDAFEKPTTVIYEGAVDLPDMLTAEDGSIAIRVTDDPFCKALIKRLRKPLVSTSANLSGQPSPATFNDVTDSIKQSVDYVVQYRQDDMVARQPSSLVKIDDDGEIKVLRP
ncbi:MAG: threonylcarbamoyl-AMP synthase [Bacteroidetes bacterium]|nr:threonylcarbamoyl-AMP synthase [Bacteroidota bacterium]